MVVQGNPKANQQGAGEQRGREREERAMKQDREGEKGKKGEPAEQGQGPVQPAVGDPASAGGFD